MSNYTRDLRSGSAILIKKDNDKVVDTFLIEDYTSHDDMRIACNARWDELDRLDRAKMTS